MGSAAGLFFASLVVMVLTYTKPNWFWNAPQMRRACGDLSQADAEKIIYSFCALLMVLALAIAVFES